LPISAANAVRARVVLVVEDEFLVRYCVTDCLRSAGNAVVEAASGEAAIALCKSDMAIDILFTDINLVGRLSGWDVAECLRMYRPDAQVLYASGKSNERQRCVPGSVFFAKPYNGADIVDACQRLSCK
jgi:two-component system, response regulator PdtaR